MRSILKNLYVQVLIAITLGVLLGYFFPNVGESMQPLSVGFIKLIKMVISPVIFCTVSLGIGSVKNMKTVGKAGGLALIYFQVLTIIALLIGLVVVNVTKPGEGMNITVTDADLQAVSKYTTQSPKGLGDFLLNIIPDSVAGAFVNNELLQVLFLAVLFGIVLQKLGDKSKMIHDIIEKLSFLIFAIVNIIMKLAPIGAFGAMAFTIGKYGISSITQMFYLMLGFYLTCLVFIFVVLNAVAKMAGFSLIKLLRYISNDILVVLGTSSSEAVLPDIMQKLEKAGVDKSIVGLVVPAGYSFNLDGTAIYLTMAAVFLAQATNTPLDLKHQILLLLILLVTSKGAAAVTGGGFIVLAASLATVGNIPVASLAIILGIDRFMSEARAITNLIGNSVATIVVAKWVKGIDMDVLHKTLSENPPKIDKNELDSH